MAKFPISFYFVGAFHDTRTHKWRGPVVPLGLLWDKLCRLYRNDNRRYTMSREQLQALYKQFENFVADCPQQEYNENKSAIIAVYSLIHKHINNEIYK